LGKFLEKLVGQAFSNGPVLNLACIDNRVNTVRLTKRLLTYFVILHALLLSFLFSQGRSLFYCIVSPSVSLLLVNRFRKVLLPSTKNKECSPLPLADRVNSPHTRSREQDHINHSALLSPLIIAVYVLVSDWDQEWEIWLEETSQNHRITEW